MWPTDAHEPLDGYGEGCIDAGGEGDLGEGKNMRDE